MNATILSANLKQARKQAGMTQTELAKKAKVSQTTISDIERGRNQGSAELPRIALALGVAVETLTGTALKLSPTSASTAQAIAAAMQPIHTFDLNKVPLIAHDQIVNWLTWHSTQELDDVSCPINIIEWLYTDMKTSPLTFVYEIQDEAMSNQYIIGNKIIIDPNINPRPTDDVCAYISGKGVIFRRYKEVNAIGDFELHPLNPLYGIYKSQETDIKILGVMIEHRQYRKG